METTNKKIKLGFTEQEFEPGIHICQIYNDEDERRDAIVNYIISGINSGEKTKCFTEKETASSLTSYLKQKGIEMKQVEKTGSFSLQKTADVYIKDNEFKPDRMLDLLRDFYKSSEAEKRNGARVIGEMTPEIESIKGGSRLMEYESKVSMLLKEVPVNAVCQYNAREFSGETIMNILKVHPYMIIRKEVVSNPFYITPEEYLESIS